MKKLQVTDMDGKVIEFGNLDSVIYEAEKGSMGKHLRKDGKTTGDYFSDLLNKLYPMKVIDNIQLAYRKENDGKGKWVSFWYANNMVMRPEAQHSVYLSIEKGINEGELVDVDDEGYMVGGRWQYAYKDAV